MTTHLMTDTNTAEDTNGSARNLSDRVAVVTGAAAGIGSAIANALAAAGAALRGPGRGGGGGGVPAGRCGPPSSSIAPDVSPGGKGAPTVKHVAFPAGR